MDTNTLEERKQNPPLVIEGKNGVTYLFPPLNNNLKRKRDEEDEMNNSVVKKLKC